LAFHSALINFPQDAQVIRAYAGLLQFGTSECMNFMEQNVGAHTSFVPETLVSSRTKLDNNNLVEQTSHLVSQINSSIETLTCLDSLQQSVAKYREGSQFSGVVSISSQFVIYPRCSPFLCELCFIWPPVFCIRQQTYFHVQTNETNITLCNFIFLHLFYHYISVLDGSLCSPISSMISSFT
jgi:hypothetical protein